MTYKRAGSESLPLSGKPAFRILKGAVTVRLFDDPAGSSEHRRVIASAAGEAESRQIPLTDDYMVKRTLRP